MYAQHKNSDRIINVYTVSQKTAKCTKKI